MLSSVTSKREKREFNVHTQKDSQETKRPLCSSRSGAIDVEELRNHMRPGP
jgi:hypothetical protein